MKIWVCHYCASYRAHTTAHWTREAALRDVGETFGISAEPTKDEGAFWTEVRAVYHRHKWANFALDSIEIEGTTIRVRNEL